MAQLSCSFTSLCGNKCDISSRWPGRQQLDPQIMSSSVDSIKDSLLRSRLSGCLSSFVFRDVPRGSIAWHPERRLRGRLYKRTPERRITNERCAWEGAYSGSCWFMWWFWWPRFHNMPETSSKIQTYNKVPASPSWKSLIITIIIFNSFLLFFFYYYGYYYYH